MPRLDLERAVGHLRRRRAVQRLRSRPSGRRRCSTGSRRSSARSSTRSWPGTSRSSAPATASARSASTWARRSIATYAEPISVVPVTLTEAGASDPILAELPRDVQRLRRTQGGDQLAARLGDPARVVADLSGADVPRGGERVRDAVPPRARRRRDHPAHPRVRRTTATSPPTSSSRRSPRCGAPRCRTRAGCSGPSSIATPGSAGVHRRRSDDRTRGWIEILAAKRPSRSAEHRASLRRLTRARVGGWSVQLGRSHHTPRGAIARMCGIVGIVSTEPANQQIYDSLLLLQHRGQDSTGIATADGPMFHMAKAQGAGARGVPHARHALAARQHGPRPRALHHEGRCRARGGGPAVLRERAVRHHPRPQRQPHEHARAVATTCSASTAGTSTPRATPRCCSTCSRPSCRGRSRASSSTPTRSSRPSSAGARARRGLVRGHLAHRRLRPARVPRPVRHPPPHPRQARDRDAGKDEWIVASESLVLENGDYEIVRDVDPGEAIFITLDGEMNSSQCAHEPAARAVLVRVRLPRPSRLVMNGISVYEARLRMGDRLADHDRDPHGQGRHRRRHADPRLVAPRRDAGRAEARHRVPRGLLQEPLRRPHVHHARAGAAQAERCARSSTPWAPSSRARTSSSSTTRSCAARRRRRSSRWRAPRVRTRSRSRRRRRPCATRTSTASTCRAAHGAHRARTQDPRDRRASSAPTT